MPLSLCGAASECMEYFHKFAISCQTRGFAETWNLFKFVASLCLQGLCDKVLLSRGRVDMTQAQMMYTSAIDSVQSLS